jgi:hypothetical protein
MFGKKKGSDSQTKDYHCATCGLDCKDQTNLERHTSWAHKDSVTGKIEAKKS